jgi:glycosyltransferase involved in cell wall biosynthesis
MKLAIVSFGHADSIMHYAKTLSKLYDVDLFFIFALNKRIESVLNFQEEKLHTGFLSDEQVERILGTQLLNFIGGDYGVKFFINYNLKLRSFKNYFLARKLAACLNKYDLIHFNGMDATIILINSFLKRKTKVFNIHDFRLHSGERGRKIINVAESLCKWIIKSKHQVIMQNYSDYNEVIEKYPDKKEKINIIPFKCLSIFKCFLNKNTAPVKSDLLFFGRISPYKGLKYLVEAVELVKLTFPDIKVLIAGIGNIEYDILKEKFNKGYLIFNRYITNEEIANYVANTKIVVCPYTDATQSGVVMTSFAFGKPVIATSVGGFLDVVEDKVTGLLIPPRDSKSLADAIISLLSDKNKLDDMSKNIVLKNEKGILSWDYILLDAKNIYDKALNDVGL